MGKKIIMKKAGGYELVNGEKTLLIPKIIEDFARKIDFSNEDMAVRFYPLGKQRDIVVDPKHQFGAPIVKGTNTKAKTLCDMYDAGDSVKILSILYKLEEKSVRDAISYCHRKAS